jgi:hypothetical protein
LHLFSCFVYEITHRGFFFLKSATHHYDFHTSTADSAPWMSIAAIAFIRDEMGRETKIHDEIEDSALSANLNFFSYSFPCFRTPISFAYSCIWHYIGHMVHWAAWRLGVFMQE